VGIQVTSWDEAKTKEEIISVSNPHRMLGSITKIAGS
jgi:hypothetical protein